MPKISYSIIQRNKSRGIMTWYARVKKEGEEPRFYSLKTTKKGEATLLLSEKINSGEFEKTSEEKLSYKTAIDLFIKNCSQNTIKNKTVSLYIHSLKFLKMFLNEQVMSVSESEIINAFNEINGNLSNGSFNLRKTICKMFFKFLSEELNLKIKNPFRNIRSRKKIPKFKKSFWTLEQISEILYFATSPKERMFWSLMAYAGLRSFEAIKFKREDIYDCKIHVIGKGDKSATLPICELLQREIDRYDGDWDFTCFSGNKSRLRNAVKKAGVEDDAGINFHRFRHSFGSNLIRAGANIKAVQLLMRHSDIQTTLNIYSHMLDGDLLESINLLKETKK